MITHISIKDFAIIKDLELDLYPGLNILTGETGAGKSIIIQAVSMALGSRADTDFVRSGADKAVVTLIAEKDGEEYIIKREISKESRSICRVNGEIVSLSELASVCRGLADIHGQYDTQSLLNPEKHTDILDSYAGEAAGSVLSKVSEIYRNFTDTSLKLRSINTKDAESARQRDLLAYEINEIDSASLQTNEDETLEEEIRLMENSETIFNSVTNVIGVLFSGDGAAFDSLSRAAAEISSVESYSDELKAYSEKIKDAYYSLEDLRGSLRSYRDSINFSQSELNEKIERLELINKLKRKYGGSIEKIREYRDKAAASLSDIENSDSLKQELESTLHLYKDQYELANARLLKLRTEAAGKLEKEITKELSELNFTSAVFKIDISKCPASEKGSSKAEFLISANRGEAPKAIARIASGGELSRIMLAMKRIICELDGIPTMIFDEIDTGISGATAGVVGEKLKSISDGKQIICITHLPQIAAMGDRHFRITKMSDLVSTDTTVLPLSDNERIEEIARLLSGTEISEAARMQAKDLLHLKL